MSTPEMIPLHGIEKLPKAIRRRLQPYRLHELEKLPKREFLVKGILDRHGMSVMYGDSNSGKTFTAVDLALRVAHGWEWCDKRIKQGAVLYIAAEGGLGLHERLMAFSLRYTSENEPPFYLLPAAVDFCKEVKDAAEVIDEANKLGQVELIVVDTLARAMSGGNENSPDDMGAFIKNCDLIRERTNAHVMIIHHAGKDSSKGGRGHSSLRAAVDTEIEVTKDESGIVTAEIKKQRDGRTGDKFSFILESVKLGDDEDGDPITSCVLSPTDETPAAKKRKLSPQYQRAFSVLTDLMAERGETGIPKKDMRTTTFVRTGDFREALLKANISAGTEPDNVRRQIQRIIEAMNNKGITATWEDKTWIVGQTGQ